MNIEIRTATLSDVKLLLEFEQRIIDAERPFDYSIKKGPTRYYDINNLIADQDVELIIAYCENVIVGCGCLQIKKAETFYSYSRYSSLGFMFVRPEYRGRGINKKIVDRLEQSSHQKGITEMRLEVYFENQPAIRAYEKAGYSKSVIEMRKTLK